MSETEKLRAIGLLAAVALGLAVMFTLQNGAVTVHTPARASLEVCAASKGSLCEVPEGSVALTTAAPQAVELGNMTVTAGRLPSDRFTEVAAAAAAAEYLELLAEGPKLHVAQRAPLPQPM